MAEYKDYYKILGVGKTAGDAELKKAFKTAARKYHPDLHPESQKAAMTEKFKEVNEAYEVLSDKQKRAVYDQVGSGEYQNYARGGAHQQRQQQQHHYGGGGPFAGADAGGFNFHSTGGFDAGDFSDFFQSIFGGMGGGRGQNPFAGFGGGRQAAQGLDSEANLSLDLQEAYKGGLVSLTLPNGQNTQVKLPPRIADGAKIKLKGLGNKTRAGAGDLYINIKIAPHPAFRLEGEDIYAAVDVMPWTAALGGAAAVNMPDGGTLNIKVPAGTASGAKLKLSGKGLGKSGNMYVQLMLNNPKHLTKAQKDLFSKLAQEAQ